MGLPGWKLDQLKEIILMLSLHSAVKFEGNWNSKIRLETPMQLFEGFSDIRGKWADFGILF